MEGVYDNDVSGSVFSPIAWVCRVRRLKWQGLLKYIHVQRTSLNRVEIRVQSPQGFVDAYKHIKKGGKRRQIDSTVPLNRAVCRSSTTKDTRLFRPSSKQKGLMTVSEWAVFLSNVCDRR